MTTSEPALAVEIAAAAAAKGVASLDAPVSGGDIGARNATLSIMIGGACERLQRVGACGGCNVLQRCWRRHMSAVSLTELLLRLLSDQPTRALLRVGTALPRAGINLTPLSLFRIPRLQVTPPLWTRCVRSSP
jgi:hypothetical protein